MPAPDVAQQYDPNRLIDTLSIRLGNNSDRMLSHVLQVSPRVIRNIRSGRLPAPASILLAMAESAGASIEELRRVLGDRRSRVRISCSIPTRRGRHGDY